MGFNSKTTVVKALNVDGLRKRLKGMSRVKVGLPKGSLPYPDGTSVIDVGFWNEFGTNNDDGSVRIPERSWLRSGVRKNLKKYRKINLGLLKKVIQGSLTTKKALNKLGAIAAGDIKENITAISKPPNAPSTIRKKGSANPLIHNTHMRNSVTYEVEK